MTGSQWACRETFVAVFVTNLPVIQPLIRQGATKLGLSTIFSKSRTSPESHQLGSLNASDNRFGRKARMTGETDLQATAWASDEQILPQENGKAARDSGGRGIVVTQEVGIRSEHASETHDPSADDWGYGSVNHKPDYRP